MGRVTKDWGMKTFPLVVLAVLWVALYALVRTWSTNASQPQSLASPDQRRWLSRLPGRLWISPHLAFLAEIIAAAGLLALATAGFFWQILLTPNAWMPASEKKPSPPK